MALYCSYPTSVVVVANEAPFLGSDARSDAKNFRPCLTFLQNSLSAVGTFFPVNACTGIPSVSRRREQNSAYQRTNVLVTTLVVSSTEFEHFISLLATAGQYIYIQQHFSMLCSMS